MNFLIRLTAVTLASGVLFAQDAKPTLLADGL